MNFSVRELESLKPRLRDGLNFSVQEHGTERVCMIEDPLASKFHRVGFDEYRFFRSLDGTQTVAAIISRLARDADGEGFDEAETMQMLRWLKENDLLAVESERADASRDQRRRALRAAVTWLNPLLLRVPLGRPDAFFTWLAARLRPVLGWFGFLLWLGVVLTGAAHLALDWGRFERGFDGILARDNWLWLAGVWLMLKVFHECGHGIFCRHYGAPVREVGVILVLFLPMGYVDATASTGIASRWRRIVISSAGMYVEVLLAALAAIWWSGTPEGRLATVLHNTVVMGSVLTVFFNANPLMRFDGYYILGDVLGIANLASRARGWLMRCFAWLLLGGRELRPERPATRREWFVAVYGVAAWLWQLLVFGGLLLAASVMFKGGGLVFAVLAAVLWVAMPVAIFARETAARLRSGSGTPAGIALRMLGACALAAAVLFIPYHKTVVAPGVVELADTRVLRAECPGFVTAIHVRDGDIVEEGALLLELRNEETAASLARLRREFSAQKQRARLAYNRGDVAEYQSEQARLAGLEKSLAEMERYASTLAIRAPIAGRVTSRPLAHMEGAYIAPGAEILRIGESGGREVKIAIAQDAEPHFRAARGLPVLVRIAGRGGVLGAILTRLDDQASRSIPHDALAAPADGPLAVRRIENPEPGAEIYELSEPYFTATVRIEGTPGGLADGEMARVKFRSPVSVNLMGELRAAFSRWVRAHGA